MRQGIHDGDEVIRGSPFPDLKGQAPLRQLCDVHGAAHQGGPFPDLKGQAPLRRVPEGFRERLPAALFLTSKVRLHCDGSEAALAVTASFPFPDLKGQAPLRHMNKQIMFMPNIILFLTSKVRLHCDLSTRMACILGMPLFLTSKVRLHCDTPIPFQERFLRKHLFLTSKVRLHCDEEGAERVDGLPQPFS